MISMISRTIIKHHQGDIRTRHPPCHCGGVAACHKCLDRKRRCCPPIDLTTINHYPTSSPRINQAISQSTTELHLSTLDVFPNVCRIDMLWLASLAQIPDHQPMNSPSMAPRLGLRVPVPSIRSCSPHCGPWSPAAARLRQRRGRSGHGNLGWCCSPCTMVMWSTMVNHSSWLVGVKVGWWYLMVAALYIGCSFFIILTLDAMIAERFAPNGGSESRSRNSPAPNENCQMTIAHGTWKSRLVNSIVYGVTCLGFHAAALALIWWTIIC